MKTFPRSATLLLAGTLSLLAVTERVWAADVYSSEPENPPVPASIMPVVILSGSDYDMGYQYGQQAGKWFTIKLDKAWAAVLKKNSKEDVLKGLKAYQYHIRKFAPGQIDMMKGMAAGATKAGFKMSVADILLLNTWWEQTGMTPLTAANRPPESEKEQLGGCEIWSAWGGATKDGKLVVANSDDNDFDPQMTIVAFPQTGQNYIAQPEAGQLANDMVMNNKGVFIALAGGPAGRKTDIGHGVTYPTVFQHVIQFAKSADEAKDMILSAQITRGTIFQVSDVSGKAYVIEASAGFKSVRKPGDFGEKDYIYNSNNYFTDEGRDAQDGQKFIPFAGWVSKPGAFLWADASVTRNLQMRNLLHNYRGKIDAEFMKMMFRFQSAGKGCLDPAKPCDANIGNQASTRVQVAVPDNGNKGKAYICTGPAARISYPIVPGGGGDYYQVSATNTYYEVALLESPAKVIDAADLAAKNSIGQAYREFMKLKYSDPGYSVLNNIYAQANEEYFKGRNWSDKAWLVGGNERLAAFGRAATYFARAQAHAQQLYEALVPAAKSPEDLGLQPWMGKDGEWVSVK